MPETESKKESSKKEKAKTSWWWMKNSEGKPSMSATFATIAFLASTGAYVAAIFEKIGNVSIRPFDAAACSTYLIPVLGLYFGRRFTDAKISLNKAE